MTYYVLFFIHLHTRRVHIAGMTPNPDGAWMAQIARNMSMVFAEEPAEFRPTHIIRDRDSKFTAQFCSILETDGIEFRPIPPRTPNLNPFAEAWVQRTEHEVLNHFIVFGESTCGTSSRGGSPITTLASASGARQCAHRSQSSAAGADGGVPAGRRRLPRVARRLLKHYERRAAVKSTRRILPPVARCR